MIGLRVFLFIPMAALLLTGCNQRDDSVLFDGQAFRGKVAFESRDNRRNFVATVRPVSASVEGAREAGRYEGVKYCITEYGTSEITWSLSPDAEPVTWSVDSDTVTFTGRCNTL